MHAVTIAETQVKPIAWVVVVLANLGVSFVCVWKGGVVVLVVSVSGAGVLLVVSVFVRKACVASGCPVLFDTTRAERNAQWSLHHLPPPPLSPPFVPVEKDKWDKKKPSFGEQSKPKPAALKLKPLPPG